MTASVQPVALYGSELRWKLSRQSKGRADEIQIQVLVNEESRAVTGCFRTTNAGALSVESGLRPAAAQLENRQRRYSIRLLSLPESDRAKELVGSRSAIGRRLQTTIGYSGRTEPVILLDAPESLDATTVVEDEAGGESRGRSAQAAIRA